MPCYTQNTATVEFGPKTDLGLFELAAQVLGEKIFARSPGRIDFFSFRLENGKLTYDPARFTPDKLAQLKRAYSEEVIKATAKKNGWQVSWSTNAAGNRVAEVERVSR